MFFTLSASCVTSRIAREMAEKKISVHQSRIVMIIAVAS